MNPLAYIRSRRAVRAARRRYELARIESLMAANEERQRELQAALSGPCKLCPPEPAR